MRRVMGSCRSPPRLSVTVQPSLLSISLAHHWMRLAHAAVVHANHPAIAIQSHVLSDEGQSIYYCRDTPDIKSILPVYEDVVSQIKLSIPSATFTPSCSSAA